MPPIALQPPRSRRTLSRLTTSFREGLQIAGEGIAELLWPTRCVLCDVPGTLLCDECRLEIPYIDPLRACSYCGQAHGRYACIDCNSFMVEHRELSTPSPLDRIASVFAFIDPCRKLVTTYKDRKEIRLAGVLAELIAAYINPSWITPGQTALVVIPARKQAIRERGFDHMQQIGEHLAQFTGLPLLDALAPQERTDQRGLSAAHRQKNMRNSFILKPQPASTALPATIILVDDVLTTGATLTAAATVLKEAGARQVFALTLGRIP